MRTTVTLNILTLGLIGLLISDLPRKLYALFSSQPQLAGTASLEIAAIRMGLAGLALLLIIGQAIWILSKNTLWRTTLEDDYAAFLQTPSPKKETRQLYRMAFIASLALCVLLAIILGLTEHPSVQYEPWFLVMTDESGILETLTALCLLVAGVRLVTHSIMHRQRFDLTASFLMPLGLGLLFIFGAGEEVSWGQHWIGFETPASISEFNIQNEFNFHNLMGYWADRLMLLFFVSYIGLLPIAARWIRPIRYLIVRLALPVGPIQFAPFAFLALTLAIGPHFTGWLSEAREVLFSVLVLAIATAETRPCLNPQESGNTGVYPN